MAKCPERVKTNDKSSLITATEEHERKISPRLIVQGGAYSSGLSELKEHFMIGIKQAAREGYAALQNGTAIDAVEVSVRALENNKYFNAGRGSFLNHDEEVECDAMIMDGKTMNTGAVMAVRHFSNPVSLSRRVMEDTDHCALCADGALEYAQNNNLPVLDNPAELIDDTSLNFLIRNRDFKDFVKFHYGGKAIPEVSHDTVSAVALDTNGNLACAASTGGIPGKLKGRVGDVPLVGCGGYANEYGAATSTGHGEQIMKMTLAREVVYNMERGLNAQISSENAVQRMQNRVKGYGGAIAIDKYGNFGKAFNTEVMIWATIKDNTLEFGMEQDEFETEQLEQLMR